MNFFINSTDGVPLLGYAYSPILVFLSFLVATGGSAVALFVASTVAKAQSLRSRQILMLAGAVAFGSAVWSMHFIGMLAFELCTPVTYNTGITFLSALPAIAAAWVVLHWISRDTLSSGTLLLGGAVTGAGIGLMHYSGMMAMRMSALLRFDPVDFSISIVAAVALATIALGARHGLIYRLKVTSTYANAIAAVVMGIAIATMHYLGMMAARFVGDAQTTLPTPPSDWFYLSILITMGITSVLGLVASGVLYTRLKDSLTSIKLHEDELQTIIQNSTEAIITTQHDGIIKSVNRTFQALFGYSTSEIKGEHLSTFLPQWSTLLNQQVNQLTYETLGKRRDGSEFPVRVTLNRFNSGEVTFYVGFLVDLSDVKKIQEKLLHDANHDFLTGLRNRRFFEDQLQLELDRSQRNGAPISLVMLDIDHFKRINDTYGHLAGDRILSLLASELKQSSRSGDIVARYGGEEFVLLLPDTDLASALDAAERLRCTVAGLEINHQGEAIRFTISLGVTCACDGANTVRDALIHEADMAMYQAKKMGRNRVEVFAD